MTLPSFKPLVLLLALGAGLLPAQSPGERRTSLPDRQRPSAVSGHDRPDLRREWNLQWFGGQLSPAYLDYKNRLADQEASRWAHTLPRPSGSPLPAALGSIALPSWVSLGPKADLIDANYPDMDSGRPVAVLCDPTAPTTLYLATSGGGIFKCTNADPSNAGDWTWASLTDALPSSGSSGNVSVGAMALNPASPGTLYMGAGDPYDAEGRGFFTSADGGATWTAATSGTGSATRSYAILPLSASTVFWGTNDGLKVSTNGGGAFTPVTVAGSTAGRVRSIQQVTASDLVCTVQNASSGLGTIHYSTNAGTSWVQATITGISTSSAGRITVVSAGDAATVWGIYTNANTDQVGRGVLKSVDKGHTWTWVPAPAVSGGLFQGTGNQMSTDGSQGFYNHALAVDPSNPSRLFVGSNLALYRSLDGGATWTQLTHWYANRHVYAHADFHAASWSPSGGTLYIANDGGLCLIRDPFRATVPTGSGSVPSDVTFIDNRRNKGLASHLVYNVGSTLAATPVDSKYRISIGLQDNGTRIRQPNTPGGALTGAESTFTPGIGGDGFGTVIHPTNGNLMLGSVYYTDIYKSTDGGANFNESITGISEANSSSLAPFQPRIVLGDTAHPNTVYTATNGVVYRSTDFGSNWTPLPTTNLPAAGTNSPSDPANALYIRNIGAALNDPNALGIAGNTGRVFLSYNGGNSWVQGGLLPNNGSFTSNIWFDRTNSQVVYLTSVAPDATKNHLWKSANGGSTWTALDGNASASNGLPFGIPIHVIQTDPGSASKLYAGTDFGVYSSADGGATWSRFGSGLPLVAVRDLYLAPDSSFLRAGTFGRGVWEIPLVQIPPSPPPVVSSFAPLSGTAGTPVTLTGTGFTGATAVAFNGVAATTFNVVSDASITTSVPSGASSGTISVTNSGGTGTSSTAFSVTGVTVSVSIAPTTTTSTVTGGQLTFTATVTGTANTAVTWLISGNGSLNSLTANSVTFTAAATPGTTALTATSAASASANATVLVTTKTGDFSGDGLNDILDLATLARAYGSHAGDSNWNAAADLNGDGVVNDLDLALFFVLAGF